MSIAVISANLGDFEKPFSIPKQTVPYDFFLLNDGNFPPRLGSMTPRLQARIPKMFAWQIVPDYDYYLWIDSSMSVTNPNCVEWFLQQLAEADIAVFKHPHRNTVGEEASYLKERLELEKTGKKQPYILPRYENEDIDGHLEEVDPDQELYASTAFIYKNTHSVRRALKEWWYFTSRYHSIDQLGFPYAIRDLNVNVIDLHYLHIPYLTHTRNK